MANILIIEGHSADRKILMTLLRSDKHNLFVAKDTTQALEIVYKEDLDLIIGDILMSDSGDYEFIKKLRHDFSHLNTPIIFFSESCYTSELMLLAKAASAVDIVIDKTASNPEILKQINAIINQKKSKVHLSVLLHELSQPLTVINAYVSGCIRRLEENVFDKKEIIDVLKSVNQQVEVAGKLIQHTQDYFRKIKHVKEEY